jgi:hypothetical protein
MKTNTILLLKNFLVAVSIALLICRNLNCFGQDTIIKNNGTKITGKILEVSSEEVRYKKANNTDGPVYIETITGLSGINYSNGIKDTFKFEKPWLVSKPLKAQENEVAAKKKYPPLNRIGNRYTFNDQIISEREMKDYLSNLHDPLISGYLRQAKVENGFRYIGFAAIPLGVAGLFYAVAGSNIFGSGENTSSLDAAKLLGVAGVACVATSICLKIKSTQHKAAALRIYQQNINN